MCLCVLYIKGLLEVTIQHLTVCIGITFRLIHTVLHSSLVQQTKKQTQTPPADFLMQFCVTVKCGY